LREAFLRILVDRIERVHEAVAEGIGVDIERRMDEVRNVAPIGLVARPEMNRRSEALALHLHPDTADVVRSEFAIAPRGVDLALEGIEGRLPDDRVEHVLDLGSEHRLAPLPVRRIRK